MSEPTTDFVTLKLHIRVRSEANMRGENPYAASSRVKSQREAVCIDLLEVKDRGGLPQFPVEVEFWRYGPGKMDSDNLTGAFKHVRDEIARHYGVDDGDPRWKWLPPNQVKDKKHFIKIEIRSIAETGGA